MPASSALRRSGICAGSGFDLTIRAVFQASKCGQTFGSGFGADVVRDAAPRAVDTGAARLEVQPRRRGAARPCSRCGPSTFRFLRPFGLLVIRRRSRRGRQRRPSSRRRSAPGLHLATDQTGRRGAAEQGRGGGIPAEGGDHGAVEAACEIEGEARAEGGEFLRPVLHVGDAVAGRRGRPARRGERGCRRRFRRRRPRRPRRPR